MGKWNKIAIQGHDVIFNNIMVSGDTTLLNIDQYSGNSGNSLIIDNITKKIYWKGIDTSSIYYINIGENFPQSPNNKDVLYVLFDDEIICQYVFLNNLWVPNNDIITLPKIETQLITGTTTTFLLSDSPVGDVTMYRNTMIIPNNSISINNNIITYNPNLNDNTQLIGGDTITISYNIKTTKCELFQNNLTLTTENGILLTSEKDEQLLIDN